MMLVSDGMRRSSSRTGFSTVKLLKETRDWLSEKKKSHKALLLFADVVFRALYLQGELDVVWIGGSALAHRSMLAFRTTQAVFL